MDRPNPLQQPLKTMFDPHTEGSLELSDVQKTTGNPGIECMLDASEEEMGLKQHLQDFLQYNTELQQIDKDFGDVAQAESVARESSMPMAK